jgi:hypothetical protein
MSATKYKAQSALFPTTQFDFTREEKRPAQTNELS